MTLPTLTDKQKYIIVGVAMVTSFAVGRYSGQKAEIKSESVTTKNVEEKQDKDTHTEKVITTVKTPDGTVKTVEKIDEVADVKIDTNSIQVTQQKKDVIPPKVNTLNISALIGNDFSKGLGIYPVYGVSVTKQILGPVTIGAYGITNGTIGLSIGLNF